MMRAGNCHDPKGFKNPVAFRHPDDPFDQSDDVIPLKSFQCARSPRKTPLSVPILIPTNSRSVCEFGQVEAIGC